jgi:beta-lactamase class A
MAAASGRHVGIRLVELQSWARQDWSLNGGDVFTAASTYKLPALMDLAQRIAGSSVRASDNVCYAADDWEDGWFTDYADRSCYSLQDLAVRAGHYSDNTAGHMLVRATGGTAALNQFTQNAGTRGSQFYDPNTTTAQDLASLWVGEASGNLGGPAAQSWLYPLLTHTEWEMGIPSGIPSSATVVHKTGWIDSTENDAALVQGAPAGDYVLAICTDGDGSDDAWSLISSISARVWAYEVTRQLTPPTPVPQPSAVHERLALQ